jgi:glucan phosphoethanolaminetransferase (alkaline phosphatase superfamily)
MFIAVGPIWFVITMYILHLFLNSNVEVEYTSEMLKDDLKILSVLFLILGLIFAGIYLFETNEQGYRKAKDAEQVVYKGEPEDRGVAYWKKKYSK